MFGLNAISEAAIADDRAYALFLQLYAQAPLPTPDYTNLITSEHADKSKFMAMIQVIIQPYIDNQLLLREIPALFDLDIAIGDQLDIIGEWVGVSRQLPVPLPNVYFSFGIAGLGFGQGTWKSPFDTGTTLISLPDDSYRKLIKSRIAENAWDGTVDNLVTIWNSLFSSAGISIAVEDYGDMTYALGIMSVTTIDAVTKELLSSNQIRLKPEAVGFRGYVIPSTPNTPFFGFGVQNSTIAGFGTGSWAIAL